MTIYEPEEDSFFLQKFVKKHFEILEKKIEVSQKSQSVFSGYSGGLVLDMGTGSGIQALTASEKADLVIALDIDKKVIKHCEKNINKENIKFFKSNIFQIFEDNFFFYDKIEDELKIYKKKICDKEKMLILNKKQIKFDLIIFNPPYLPQELKKRDIRLEGGKKGYEVIEKFLNKVYNYLKKDGNILLLFSSFTGKKKVNNLILKNKLKFIELEKKHIFFEDLYVYYICKN
jgi:release factor glutamine methyltransferase